MTDQAQRSESVIPGKPTSASRTTLSHIMTGSDTNLLGTVHGGVIMKLVDDAAGAVAGRHSGGPAVTASMDEMVFLEPVRVGDLVHVKAQVNWTGRSSMEVGVRVMAERWNESTPPSRSARPIWCSRRSTGTASPAPYRRWSPRPSGTGGATRRPRSGVRTGWPAAAPSGNCARSAPPTGCRTRARARGGRQPRQGQTTWSPFTVSNSPCFTSFARTVVTPL